MRKRVNAKSSVIDEHRAPEESDDQARPSGEDKTEKGERHGRRKLVFVQPHQFRKAHEVADLPEIGRIVLASEARG